MDKRVRGAPLLGDFDLCYSAFTMQKIKLLFQFVGFLKERKKFWLIPIIVVFFLVGLLLVTTKGSVVAPFIYTLF